MKEALDELKKLAERQKEFAQAIKNGEDALKKAEDALETLNRARGLLGEVKMSKSSRELLDFAQGSLLASRGEFEAAEHRLERACSGKSNHFKTYRDDCLYSLADTRRELLGRNDGLSPGERIERELSPLFERFGWAR